MLTYRLILANASITVDLPEAATQKLLALIADANSRWIPIPIGDSGDYIVPAHVLFVQRL